MELQLLVSGIATGGVYALIALGFTLLWNTGAIINFAQGDFAMLGMYFALTFYVFMGWSLPLALLASLLAVALVGLIVERLAVKHLYGRDILTIVIATIGTQIFLSNLARIIWGPAPYSFPPFFGEYHLTRFRVSAENVGVIALVAAAIVLFHLVSMRTRMGLAMRAVAQDEETAALMGIPVHVVRTASFVLAVSLGAIGGMSSAPLLFVSPDIGLPFIMKAFIAAVVGGFGNYLGALLGALFIGIIDNMSAFFISAEYRDVITFTVLILILMFKPSGLLKATGGS